MINEIEFELIKYYLQMNIDNGSTSFRNQSLSLLKKVSLSLQNNPISFAIWSLFVQLRHIWLTIFFSSNYFDISWKKNNELDQISKSSLSRFAATSLAFVELLQWFSRRLYTIVFFCLNCNRFVDRSSAKVEPDSVPLVSYVTFCDNKNMFLIFSLLFLKIQIEFRIFSRWKKNVIFF